MKIKIKYIVKKPNGYILSEIFPLRDIENGYVTSWIKNNCIGTNSEIFKCRFTGLKDKNGKEIYEGDIVKHHRVYTAPTNYYTGEPAYDELEYIRIGHITIRPSCGIALNGTIETIDYNECKTLSKGKYSGNPGCWSEYSEIIGNKFQNSELMEKP